MLKYCAVFSLCAGLACGADFFTGQAARLVIGQSTFTSQDSGASATLLGAVGGVAYANNTLIVADSNRTGLTPLNARVLVFSNFSNTLPTPTTSFPVNAGRCPVCTGIASSVVGQKDFSTVTAAVTQTGVRLPTAVATDGKYLVVADTAANRVLIWNNIPLSNGVPADVVLGQPNFTGIKPVVVDAKSLRAPQGVWIQGGKLFVADTLNNRVLIWNRIPTANEQAADVVLGQPDFNTAPQPDLTKATLNAKAETLLNPVSVTTDGLKLYVTDLGHNRVVIWNSIPTRNYQPADIEVGQKDMENATPNDSANLCDSNGTDSDGNKTYPERCGKTLSFPRFALSDGKRLFIADGGNDRVLIYNSIPTGNAPKPDVILGQPDENSSVVTSFTDLFHPLLKQSASDVTPTPTALAWDGTNLFVTDPSNRRVLVFTAAEPRVPINGVRNAASREVYALGAITVSGTIAADDVITVKINDKSYTYKIVKDDTFVTILKGIANSINTGNGDPNVTARYESQLGTVKLQAKKGGPDGNSITISTSLSDKAQIVVNTSGSTLTGGQDAAIVAPGTIVTFLGTKLANVTASADPNANILPRELGNVQVYFDGIRAPLLLVSPTEVRAQIPFEVSDTNSISAYIRIANPDGSVTVTTAVGVPISQQNPGIFSQDGPEPRVALAYHGSSFATGTISIDGLASPGDVATVKIEDRPYSYTVQPGDTLANVRDALIALINGNFSERVVASAASAFTRLRLRAKVPGPEGNNIPFSGTSSANSSISVGGTSTALCCANVGGAPITNANPAVPGETIVVFATGLGVVQPDDAKIYAVTGQKYNGPVNNDPNAFVSSLAGGSTANVISAGLAPGSIGTYRVELELSTGITPSPLAQLTISQDIYTSNVVTLPVAGN